MKGAQLLYADLKKISMQDNASNSVVLKGHNSQQAQGFLHRVVN